MPLTSNSKESKQENGVEDIALIKTPLTEEKSPDPTKPPTEKSSDPTAVESSVPEIQIPTGRDGGYGWVVVFAAMAINVLVAGYMKSFGLIYKPIKDRYPETSTATAGLMMGLLNGCRGILAPMAGALSVMIGPRKCTILGACLSALGLLLAIPGISPLYLAFTIGALVGIGICLSETPGYIVVSEYFLEKRSTANGLRTAGNAGGGVLFPFFVVFILEYLPFQSCLIILAGIMLQICVLGMLFRPFNIHKIVTEREFFEKLQKTDPVSARELAQKRTPLKQDNTSVKQKKSPLNFSLLKNPAYIMYLITILLCNIAVPNVLQYMPLYGRYRGLTEVENSIVLSTVSIFDFFARMILGWLSDKKIYAKRHAFVFGMLLAGTSLILLPLAHNMWSILGFLLLRTFGIANFWSLISVLLADQFGSQNIATTWGFFRMVQGITNFIYPPLLGVVADSTGSMSTPYILMGGMQILAGIIFALQPLVIRLTGIDVELT